MSFTALTCNVLADGYIRRDWYPNTPDEWLDPGRRHPAMAEHLAAQDADLICLQEVEAPMYATIAERLARDGYVGELALKGNSKPDGCATFWRGSTFTRSGGLRLEYNDGTAARAASGHIAQITTFEQQSHRLGIANTHIKWDAPKTAPERSYAAAQIAGLLAACAAAPCDAWIICGDFNLTPDAPVMALLRDAGFEFAHHAHPLAYTAAPNRVPRVIDYLFHSRGLAAAPAMPPAITAQTPLPGPGRPSDHLALAARFDWL